MRWDYPTGVIGLVNGRNITLIVAAFIGVHTQIETQLELVVEREVKVCGRCIAVVAVAVDDIIVVGVAQ